VLVAMISRAAILKTFPFLYGARTRVWLLARLVRHGGSKGLFRHIYRSNSWGSDESASGPGSTALWTQNLRNEIPNLLHKYPIRTFLDAPCGDYNWFRLISLPENVRYIGGDIVPEIVKRNTELFSNEKTEFIVLDITRDPLPRADLWMCRDVLLHLSDAAIMRLIANFLRSNIQYFFAGTNFRLEVNRDSVTGDARAINLQRPPFSFPEPLEQIDDWNEGPNPKAMALWTREMIAASLVQNPMAPKALGVAAGAALHHHPA
jgi:hypothetical protein